MFFNGPDRLLYLRRISGEQIKCETGGFMPRPSAALACKPERRLV